MGGVAQQKPPPIAQALNHALLHLEPGKPAEIAQSHIDGRRFRCTMRVDCGQLDPGAVIRPMPSERQPRTPAQLDEEELADWRAGRNAVYQLAALTIGARLAVADGR
jgi:hypothetical protein